MVKLIAKDRHGTKHRVVTVVLKSSILPPGRMSCLEHLNAWVINVPTLGVSKCALHRVHVAAASFRKLLAAVGAIFSRDSHASPLTDLLL